MLIDTPPDLNVLSRNAVACSDLVAVPVDSSEMSIHCLEDLLASCSHIQKPVWTIVRSIVNKQASRMQRMTSERLGKNLRLGLSSEEDDEAGQHEVEDFLSLVEQVGSQKAVEQTKDQKPIYLLNSVVYRSEKQNRLTFLGKTAFDSRATADLARQYSEVAREFDEVLSLVASQAGDDESNDASYYLGAFSA